MKKEVELQRDFGISRLTDYQEFRFANARSAEKRIYRLPMYDMLYNQRYRNMFEWNQQLEVIQSAYKPPDMLERTLSNFNFDPDKRPINFDKLSTLTMLALNLPYITCPGFDFDQDLTSEELPFKFKNKKVRTLHADDDGEIDLRNSHRRVLYDGENN